MLGRLAVRGSLGICLQLSSMFLAGKMAHPHAGAGRCWQALEGAPQLSPFSQMAMCKEPCQQTQSPRRPKIHSHRSNLQSSTRAQPEARPICRKWGCTKHTGFHCQGFCPS